MNRFFHFFINYVTLYSWFTFLSYFIVCWMPIKFLSINFFIIYCFILPTITLIIFLIIYRFKENLIEDPYKFCPTMIKTPPQILLLILYSIPFVIKVGMDIYSLLFTFTIGTIWLVVYTYVQSKLGKRKSEKYDITMPWIYSPLERKIIKK